MHITRRSRRVRGEENSATLDVMSDLADLYREQENYAQAEPLFTRVLEVRRRVLGEAHPSTLISMDNVALLYRNQGKYAQAEPLVTKVLGEERHVLGDENPDTLITMNNLAGLYRDQGKNSQAEMLYIKVLELQRRVLGAEHPRRLASMKDLAVLYLNQLKYQQAETLLRQALESYQKSMTSTWDRYHCESLLGASLAGQRKYADAEVLLLSGHQGMLDRKAAIPPASRYKLEQTGRWIVQLYQDWGKPEKATEWRKKLRLIPSTAGTTSFQ